MRRDLLEIADELRGLAGTGLHYTESHFDRERYERLMRIAARLAALEGSKSADALEVIYRSADQGYITPKIDVRLAVFREDHVLLVQERSDHRWALPGGFVDIGDSPSEAAARETAEEAGVETRVRRLVGVFDNRCRPETPPYLFHVHKLVFMGELVDPDAQPHGSDETIDSTFHPVSALPELSLGRTVPFHIEEALRIKRDPHALPFFD